jgi:hypothetical protein
MVLLLGVLSCFFGVLISVSPFVLGYSFAETIVAAAIGISCVLLSILAIKFKTKNSLAFMNIIIAIITMVFGVVELVINSQGARFIIIGLVLLVLNFAMLPFMIAADKAEFYNKSGAELATVTAIRPKGDNLIVRSVLLGSMPETIYVRPGELCKMIALLDSSVFLFLVSFLYRGYKENKRAASKVDESE